VKRGATVSKREFLQRSAAIAAAEMIGAPPEMGLQDAWAEGFRWVNRRCAFCSLGCKVNIGMQNGEAIAVRRDKSAANGSVLCFEAAKFLAQAARSAESHSPDKRAICIAAVVLQTAPGRARDVAQRMIKRDGLEIIGIDASSRVVVVWKHWSFASLEQSATCVLADDDIESLLPVFFGCYPSSSREWCGSR
jgi:nitrate reductase NapAB chaperone NapD